MRTGEDEQPLPPAYKTRSWPAYSEALKRGGSLTIWSAPDMTWKAAPTVKRGRQRDHSDAAIQTCLKMKSFSAWHIHHRWSQDRFGRGSGKENQRQILAKGPVDGSHGPEGVVQVIDGVTSEIHGTPNMAGQSCTELHQRADLVRCGASDCIGGIAKAVRTKEMRVAVVRVGQGDHRCLRCAARDRVVRARRSKGSAPDRAWPQSAVSS